MYASESRQKQKKASGPVAPGSIIGRVPPHNVETEMAVLGAVLKDPDIFEDLATMLSPECFYDGRNREVWEAMVTLSLAGNRIDLVLVNEELIKRGAADRVGAMYLVNLTDAVAVTANVEHWAGELKEYRKRRKAIQMGLQMAELGFDMSVPAADSAIKAQETLDEILEDRVRVKDQDPAQYIHEWIDYVEKLRDFSESRVKTPFYKLNQLVGGFFPGEVTVLAARPEMGKTALALNIVEYALKKGNPCAMFSLEMTRFALTNRMCASGRILGEGHGLDAQKFRSGEFEKEDWAKIYEFADAMRGHKFRVWDKSSVKPSEIRSQSRVWRREMGGLGLIVVDYLQLIDPESRGASREREVSDISRWLKKIAVELEAPILVLAQLSRAAEQSKKPLLSHLRESGAIEQDADSVFFLWPKDRDQKKEEQTGGEMEDASMVDLIVAKGRSNRKGTVPLIYLQKYLQFVNPSRVQAEG